MISKILKALKQYQPEVRQAGTGTFYIKFTGSKVKQIRIANHPGQKTSRNCWELRSDSQNQRRKDGRIYNFRSVDQLIADFN
jgi:hypothetical protein